MSIATDVSRIKGNITAALAAIANKGVTVPDGSTSDALASLIESIEAGGGGGGADISPWIDIVTFSITPSEDLTGSVDFTSFIPGRTEIPSIFILGNRANTSGSPYVQSMAQISTWNSWKRLYYTATNSTSSYPTLAMHGGNLKVTIGSYKLEAGVPYFGVMLWK